MDLGRRTACFLITLSLLGAVSCSILPFQKKPSPGPRRAALPQVAKDDLEFAALGTSTHGPDAARAITESILHDLVVDTLSRESGSARFRLSTGQDVATDRLTRSIASLIVLRSKPMLLPEVATVRVETPDERGDGLWTCRLQLRLAAALHESMRDEMRLSLRERLGYFSKLVDSTQSLVSDAPFGAAVNGLSGLYERGCTEWLLSDRDMAAIVGQGLDALQRRVRINFTGTRPEECLYHVSVQTVDRQGRRMPAVPLSLTVRPGTGRVIVPDMPSSGLGEAVFLIEPSVPDSIALTVELSRTALVERVSPALASGPLTRIALGGRTAPPVRARTVIDLRREEATRWDVRLIPRWVWRGGILGRSPELSAITAAAVIDSVAEFRRRGVIRCTGITIGDARWVPEAPGLLLASFRLSQGGRQMRQLATGQLVERVTELLRKRKGGAPSPIRIGLSLELDAACFASPLRLEQSREFRLPTQESR